jgi:competence protein ComEA
MKPGREQVLGSFTLLAVTALLILIALPSRTPHDPGILEIPFAVEKPGTIAVEIAGESGRNGIYFIPRGTTVAAFLDMAGITADYGIGEVKRFGALKSATTVTLPPMFSGVSVGTMAADKRLALGISIDINRATLEELVLIPGIGEKTAERIVEDRQLNGTFRKLEELTRVKGIKEKRLEKFRRYLCIGC